MYLLVKMIDNEFLIQGLIHGVDHMVHKVKSKVKVEVKRLLNLNMFLQKKVKADLESLCTFHFKDTIFNQFDLLVMVTDLWSFEYRQSGAF